MSAPEEAWGVAVNGLLKNGFLTRRDCCEHVALAQNPSGFWLSTCGMRGFQRAIPLVVVSSCDQGVGLDSEAVAAAEFRCV